MASLSDLNCVFGKGKVLIGFVFICIQFFALSLSFIKAMASLGLGTVVSWQSRSFYLLTAGTAADLLRLVVTSGYLSAACFDVSLLRPLALPACSY